MEISLFSALARALRFDPTVFRDIQLATNGLQISLIIVLLAGLSEALGQSVVLFANKVSRGRFLGSLIVSGLIFGVVVLCWTTTIWLVNSILLGHSQIASFPETFRVVGLGFSPLIFGFFILLPFVGGPIAAGLAAWSFILVLFGLRYAFDFSLMEALYASTLGWLLYIGIKNTIGYPLTAAFRSLKRTTAGKTVHKDLRRVYFGRKKK